MNDFHFKIMTTKSLSEDGKMSWR